MSWTLLTSSRLWRLVHFSFLSSTCTMGWLNFIEQLGATRKGMPSMASLLMRLTTKTSSVFTSLTWKGSFNTTYNGHWLPTAVTPCKSIYFRQLFTRSESLLSTYFHNRLVVQPVFIKICTGLPCSLPPSFSHFFATFKAGVAVTFLSSFCLKRHTAGFRFSDSPGVERCVSDCSSSVVFKNW